MCLMLAVIILTLYVLISAEPPPSPPLNLTVTSSTLSSVTISWVAPLDTPLCVHSYTVTVWNSSQVMVYNTTDNRSSLSITDLTSDGEYSVTVAGRDGAGRLGQESEELNITLKGIICVSFLIVPATSLNKFCPAPAELSKTNDQVSNSVTLYTESTRVSTTCYLTSVLTSTYFPLLPSTSG